MAVNTDSLRVIAFIWIIVGTVGLLTNEFIVDLGRVAVLASAAVNLVGLVALGYSLLLDRRR